MKTGIVRRIDDLGRVIIPKEIRNKLGFREGMPLEISLKNGGVCFTPYQTNAGVRIKDIVEDICLDDYDEEKQEEIRENLKDLKEIANNLEGLGV